MNTSVVIVCAGNSTRMGGVNKILLPLGERLVIGVTMQAFQKCESVKEIIIVAREDDIPAIKSEAEAAGITKLAACTIGGSTRQESVINGVRCISKETEFIAVHDGARPLVKPEHIEKVIKDAVIFGGATLGVPVKDTIKTVEDGLITDTPPRKFLYITQTPQIISGKSFTLKELILLLSMVLTSLTIVSLLKPSAENRYDNRRLYKYKNHYSRGYKNCGSTA